MALNIGELVAFLKMDKADWDRTKVSAKRDLDDIADEADKSGQKIDKSTKDTAKKVEKNFNPKMFAGLTVGLPAAAAIGAAAVAGSLGLMTAGFAAFGISAVAKSDAVQARLGVLTSQFKSDAAAMSAPLQDDVVGAIDDVGAAWTRLQPQVASAVQASAPQIREMTGAATDLAENAMPGVLTAVRAAGPVFQGLRTFAGEAGQGISEFAANASRGAQGADTGLSILGGTVRTVEGRLGSLFANVANGSAGPLRSLDTIVDQLTGGLVDLTAQGSGAIGFLQGFSTTGSGLATMLHGVLAAVSALPPEVTQFAGSFGAASMVATKFGIDAGKGFDGLGEKIKGAEGLTGKFGAAVGGLAAGAINPAFIAVSALSLGLNILGESQEKAAAYAAAHAENVRGLTDAIRQDNGVLGEATRAKNAQALADKNAAANLSSFGQNITTATAAIYGSSTAYESLRTSSIATLRGIADNAGIVQENRDEFLKLGQNALDTGRNYDQLKSSVLEAGKSYDSSGESAQRLSAAQQTQIEQILNGLGAVGEQINAQKKAAEAYIATEHALTGLNQAEIEARDAVTKHTQATQDAVGGQLSYRSSVEQTKKALDDYVKINKDGKASEDDKAKALLGAESAMHSQIIAAGQAAAATAVGKTENEKAAISAAAMNRETVNLADTWKGALPASLQQGIGMMNLSEARAAGLTVAIDGTGHAVYRLPDGKFIAITSSADQEAAKVSVLADRIAALHDRDVHIAVTTFYGTVGQGSSLTGPAIARKDGGLVGGYANGGMPRFPDGGLFRGVGGPRDDANLVAISNKEFIVNAAATAKNLPLLYAINSGAQVAPAAALAGAGGGHARATVNIGTFNPPANASPADIAEELDWLSRTGG